PLPRRKDKRRSSWEAFTFSKGVFQLASPGNAAAACSVNLGRGALTGTGVPVPPPPGICLVDQAKELQARRKYEVSLSEKALAKEKSRSDSGEQHGRAVPEAASSSMEQKNS
ncbi:unnamed protein product, partial [Ectocarpus sp. 4 AP-2014]